MPQFPLLSWPFPFSDASLEPHNEKRKKSAANRQGGPKNAPSIPGAHLGCQESIHLIVEGVEEETQGLPRGRRAELSPGQTGSRHGGPVPLCPPYLLMVCLMGLSCRWM